jgi:DNA polymerase III epsilon subunit-like protein
MATSSKRLIFFDIESGGLNPRRHPIVQLAAVAVDKDLQLVEAFEAKIRFDRREANRNSLRKNHFHPGVWAREAHEPEAVARKFAEFLRRHATVPKLASDGRPYHVAQLVAHNAAFDGPFLQAWYERLNTFLPARYQVLCTLQRALWYFHEHPEELPPADFKLATLCKYFGVAFHAASAHEAMADVSATVDLYRALTHIDKNTSANQPRRSQRSAA